MTIKVLFVTIIKIKISPREGTRNMKFHFIIASLLLPCLLCACSLTASIDSTTSETPEDNLVEISETCNPPIVVGPVTEFTLENQIKGVQNTYQNVCDSYAKLQELANTENASKKGRKTAIKVEKNYAERIEELEEIDFSQLTTDELLSLSIELTDMITAIREAKDALTFE